MTLDGVDPKENKVMNTLDFTMRLGLAFFLGTAIGFEREWRQKSAGLRTNTLVSVGSAAFVLLSYSIGGDATGRVASYIVSGIGFLGAGVIMKDGLTVRGLNTAATIWCSASVGSLAGVGLIKEASIVTAVIMLAHLILRPVSNQIHRYSFKKSTNVQTDYLFKIKCKNEVENRLRVLLMQYLGTNEKVLLKSLASDDFDDEPQYALISAEIVAISQQDSLMEKMASRLTIEEDVQKVSWEILGTQHDV